VAAGSDRRRVSCVTGPDRLATTRPDRRPRTLRLDARPKDRPSDRRRRRRTLATPQRQHVWNMEHRRHTRRTSPPPHNQPAAHERRRQHVSSHTFRRDRRHLRVSCATRVRRRNRPRRTVREPGSLRTRPRVVLAYVATRRRQRILSAYGNVTAFDWSNLNVAAAFILGAILATVATIRIVRAVSATMRDERRKDRDL